MAWNWKGSKHDIIESKNKMKQFSKSWKSSKKPRKQRKYLYNAPLHIRKNFLSANLSKELRKKYSIRSLSLRKGDKVKVMRGQFKKHNGSIVDVDRKNIKVYIDGCQVVKKDGTKVNVPIHPSNLQIIELNLDDKKRRRILERKRKDNGKK